MGEIRVGMGATILMHTDMYPATVIEVLGQKEARIKRDKGKRVDSNGRSENQSWEFFPDPKGEEYQIRQNSKGEWRISTEDLKGRQVLVGDRQKYIDPSF